MNYYKIKELSDLTSVTVRTLQYYDEINLLKPSKRSQAGYRLYSEEDLLQLQQIITFKYFGLSLTKIKQTLNSPNFNVLASLISQKTVLTEKVKQLHAAIDLLTYMTSQLEVNEKINWKSLTQLIHILEKDTMSQNITNNLKDTTKDSALGKITQYESTYNSKLLYPISRTGKREEIGIDQKNLPFFGFDYWNHYEVSWLNSKGKPVVAIAQIYYDCHSPFIVESKSLKLYFNSLNNTKFESIDKLKSIIQQDLMQVIEADVQISLIEVYQIKDSHIQACFSGDCIDRLDIDCDTYKVTPSYLVTDDIDVSEVLYSDLLKSNCLVTSQPDWGSVQITYTGKKINHAGLLKYIVSFRNHDEFHEQCIERIFVDIMRYCQPKSLTVYGRYTRRGGLDINPYRSTERVDAQHLNARLIRQ